MSDWKLKILTGAHAGSELDLSVGDYICGSDDDDDLVFQEESLLPAHFSLRVEEQHIRLTLRREGSRLLVNGDVSDKTELVIEELCTVSVEEFQFAVANSPVEWPEPILPKSREVQEDQASDETSEVPDSIEAKSWPLPGLGWSETFSRMKVGLGAVGACTGLMMLLAIGSMSNAESKSPENAITSEKIRLESEASKQLGLDDVTVLPLEDGISWLVEGYVDNASELDRLARWVEAKKLQATLKVKVTEELIKGTEIALTALGYSNVSVSRGDRPGYLILKGNVVDDAAWKKNRGRLQVDVPGVIGFDDQVTADTKLALAPLPDLVVKGIYMGKTPFFVLSNGEKYFVGSQLRYGYRVEDISPNMLQLRRGDKLIQYRLGVD